MDVNSEANARQLIELDHRKIVELSNTPRHDMNPYDHSGAAALKVVFSLNGSRSEVIMPVMLQPTMVCNTQWIKMSGSKVFELKKP